MLIYIVICLGLFLFVIFDFALPIQRRNALYFICFLLVLFVGFRGESGIDSLNYIDFFKYQTDVIWDWEGVDAGYSEWGFYGLSVLIKSIYDNYVFYFLSISFITILFLRKSLITFCVYPILGLCVYYARFLIIRDMNQIRQALAIVIIIYALKYLNDNRVRTFLFFLIMASLMHYSLLIVSPFLFFYNRRFSLKQILYLLLCSFIVSLLIGNTLKYALMPINNVKILTYVGADNLGVTNPLIYYQIFLCVMYFYYERIIIKIQFGYNLIRNAYLYSTMLLILLSGLGEIGGRLATIFATCEIFIIPSLCNIVKSHKLGYVLSSLLVVGLFYFNYLRILKDPSWFYY